MWRDKQCCRTSVLIYWLGYCVLSAIDDGDDDDNEVMSCEWQVEKLVFSLLLHQLSALPPTSVAAYAFLLFVMESLDTKPLQVCMCVCISVSLLVSCRPWHCVIVCILPAFLQSGRNVIVCLITAWQYWTEYKITCVSSLRYPVQLWRTPNGHISATCRLIDFVFGSRVGFLQGRTSFV